MTAPLTSAQRAALRELVERIPKEEREWWPIASWKAGSHAHQMLYSKASPSSILSLLDENEELRTRLREMIDDAEKVLTTIGYTGRVALIERARAALSEETKEARDAAHR